jgi:hypothetical protein
MRHKTQRAPRITKGKKTAFQTIPELRRSFDYIDEFVRHRLASGTSKEHLVKEVQREWFRVFSKRLEKKNATAFVEHMMERAPRRRGLRSTQKRGKKGQRGGLAPVMDPTTQPGAYLASGSIPTSTGAYPLANGAPSAYGSLTEYISKGFQTPEIASPGQAVWPSPAPNMGSNRILGGGRAIRAKRTGGSLAGSLLTQAFNRPFQSDAPPSVAQDAQTAWYGRELGPSSDQIQRQPAYRVGDSVPPPINIRIDV